VESEFNALLSQLHASSAVSYHLGDVMEGLMEFHPLNDKKPNRFKREFTDSFIKKSKPRLHLAMDHLDRFAMVIGNLEMAYQQLLDHPEWDLEGRVSLEDTARNHIVNLKRLHGRQKETLTTITQAFLEISKNHIKQSKKENRPKRGP